MKIVQVIAKAEVMIFRHFNVSSDYEIKGSTPYEVYQELRGTDEPDMTVGDIDLYDFGVVYGKFTAFENVTIDNTENPWGPVRVIPELNRLAELKKNLLNFFNNIDKAEFEIVYGLVFTEEQWDDFLNYMNETNSVTINNWFNQYVENWRTYRGNLGNIEQAA